MKAVTYLQIQFQFPGPHSSHIDMEIKEIIRYIGPKYNHDFSGSNIEHSIVDIPDINNYEIVTFKLIAQLEEVGMKDYEIQRHGLYADNPRFEKVQLAWAFK